MIGVVQVNTRMELPLCRVEAEILLGVASIVTNIGEVTPFSRDVINNH